MSPRPPAEPAVTEPAPSRPRGNAHRAGAAALTLGALGVVFGDIGTSPLYAMRTVFGDERVPVDESGVYGIISLIFWAVTIVVSLKYVTFVMRAENEGEGGIMALIALIQRIPGRGRFAGAGLIALGIFGGALFYGDGMITPAISVLSAVEGLEIVEPSLESLIVPITVAILAALFAIQRFGTGTVGRFFGPIVAVWFITLGVAGLVKIVEAPAVLKALSPSHGIEFLFENGSVGFLALGGVVLAITGAEALYADMGHFGRPAIRRAWFLLVFPALMLNYLGQGALILESPEARESPFYLLIPEWGRIPMIFLATAATVIASQAVISGAFSVTRQAVQLGFLPRVTIRQTSAQEIGQVYVPAVNWGIFAAVVALVIGFGSSEALASAYGIAVTGTLAIDTILFFVVVRLLWRKPLGLAVVGAAAFLVVDLGFFAANLPKIPDGGWFPLVIAFAIFLVLLTWQKGREIISRNRAEEEGPLRAFVDEVRAMQPPVYRAPGTAVFLNAGKATTPLALRANVEHNNTLHEHVVIVSLETLRVPHVADAERLTVDELGYSDDGITHLTARFGFQDEMNVPRTLRLAAEEGLERPVDVDNASYYLSKMTIVPSDARTMRPWRKRLFMALSRNAASPVSYFCLPDDRTVVMGSHVEI